MEEQLSNELTTTEIMNKEIKLYLKHLKEVCPNFTAEELENFALGLSVSHLDKNQTYLQAGKVQEQGGFLINGLIRAYYTDENASQKTIYFIPENEYAFHYSSFMSNVPSPLTFKCLEPTIIVHFPRHYLAEAYHKFPSFNVYGRLIIEEKHRIQQNRLEGLLFQNAEQRYNNFVDQYPDLFSRVSISHLCSYLGVERQTLTRIRNKLYQLNTSGTNVS